MSGKERAIAAFLLAIAVAGGALMPRLLSAAPKPLGIALGPGPGRSVVQAPAIPKTPRNVAPVPPRVAPPAEPAPQSIARITVKPTPKPSAVQPRHASTPPPPPTAVSPPPPPPPTTTASPTPQALSPASTRPGNGYGDTNHVHTGPPGHAPESAAAGSHLRGSGHGKGHAQVSSHTVGTHDRSVGHLATAPTGAAPPSHAAGPKARPDAGNQGSQGGPPQAVTQDQSQSQNQGQDNGHGNGHGH
jgi:hypothetical protein